MKLKDVLIALVVALIVGAVCYALAISRPNLPPTPSHPFSMTAETPAAGEGKVIMRVNGEPVTLEEFRAAYRKLPEEMQQQFSSEGGKLALAEQLIRMKLLEQEARRLGLDRNALVSGELAAGQTDVLAGAAADKLAPMPSAAEVQKYYAQNQGSFETLDVSHILFAYAGGQIASRHGQAPSEKEALQRANQVYAKIRAGADFAALARQYSDDPASAEKGGEIGAINRGMLPQELEAEVWSIPAGQVSPPVISPYGIHIFKVNQRGTAPLAQIGPGLAQRVRQQKLLERVEAMRKSASVQFDPSFFPQKKAPPARKKS